MCVHMCSVHALVCMCVCVVGRWGDLLILSCDTVMFVCVLLQVSSCGQSLFVSKFFCTCDHLSVIFFFFVTSQICTYL